MPDVADFTYTTYNRKPSSLLAVKVDTAFTLQQEGWSDQDVVPGDYIIKYETFYKAVNGELFESIFEE